MNTLAKTDMRKDQEAVQMRYLVLRQFLKHRMAVLGGFVIVAFVILAICAPWISAFTGLSPSSQNVSFRYLKPMEKSVAAPAFREMKLEAWMNLYPDEAAKLRSKFTQSTGSPAAESTEDFQKRLANMSVAEVLEKLQGHELGRSTGLEDLFRSFETTHIFGTDEIGRDVFIRLIYGARVSIGVGLLVALFAGCIGFLIGSCSGYYGGWVDIILMRITDSLLSLPTIPLLIVFAAIDLKKVPLLNYFFAGEYESIWKMVFIMCLFSWTSVARIVRGNILSLKELEFVQAARSLGATDAAIIFRHLLPNVVGPLLVAISLGVGEAILWEAALSFLGLGVMPPTPSWGNMLNNAQELIFNNVWLAIMPGLFILLTVVSFNFFGDGLRDSLDPKSARRR